MIMGFSHYHSLLIGYLAALIGWWIICRFAPSLWPQRDPIQFPRPWLEVLLAVTAAAAVIGIGVLYSQRRLLPTSGKFGPFWESINQIIIFSPMIALLAFRRHAMATAWLPTQSIPVRVMIGIALAWLAVVSFTTVHRDADAWHRVLYRIALPRNTQYLVQVFLEDLSIAILCVRLQAAIGIRPTLVLVAALFAAGHVPALLAQGVGLDELTSLFLDAGLVVVVLLVLQRARDIWWFCWVHFAMDMMQFPAILGTPGAGSASN